MWNVRLRDVSPNSIGFYVSFHQKLTTQRHWEVHNGFQMIVKCLEVNVSTFVTDVVMWAEWFNYIDKWVSDVIKCFAFWTSCNLSTKHVVCGIEIKRMVVVVCDFWQHLWCAENYVKKHKVIDVGRRRRRLNELCAFLSNLKWVKSGGLGLSVAEGADAPISPSFHLTQAYHKCCQ